MKPTPDFDVNNAPDYVKPYITASDKTGPAELLLEGSWCGHGEPLFRIYDVTEDDNNIFKIFLPNDDLGFDERMTNSVKLMSIKSGRSFFIYDAGKHPASFYHVTERGKNDPPEHWKQFICNCDGEIFKCSIGFEIPGDSSQPNDTSWFALAAECPDCKRKGIVYDNETA